MSAEAPGFPKYLRPEARPSRPDLLDAAQQGAFYRIVDTLLEASDRLRPHQPASRYEARPDTASWLNRDRSSQILFLSGGRGTGKTTVLTSLIAATQLKSEVPGRASGSGTDN
jgi:hypothetical protein